MKVLAYPGQFDELLGWGRCAVTDVIDAPGQGIHGRKGVALGDPKQPDAVPEVLGFSSGDLLTGPVGGFGVHPARLVDAACNAPTSRTPRRSGRGRHRWPNTSYPARSIASSAARPPAAKPQTATRDWRGSCRVKGVAEPSRRRARPAS